jgi:hypothetical protein
METSVTELYYKIGLNKKNYRIVYYLLVVLSHFYMHIWFANVFPTLSFLLKLCFLTKISFYSNLIYYSYVLVMQLNPSENRFTNFKFLQALFKFCFTISFVVLCMYWGMIFVDPSLLMDNPNMPVFPIVLDIFLHGLNFALNLVEHLYMFPKSDSKEVGLKFYLIFSLFYGGFIRFINHFYGIETYAFVSKLGIIEFAAIIGIATFLVYFGDFIYRFFLKVEKKK